MIAERLRFKSVVATSGGFDPSQLSGLQLWLKADAGVTLDGSGKVQTWADQSGNGRDAAQANSAVRPSYTAGGINGKSSLVFSGTETITGTGSLMTGGVTVFVVAKYNSATGRQALFNLGNTGGSNYDQYFAIEQNTYGTIGDRLGLYSCNNAIDSSGPSRTSPVLVTACSDLIAGESVTGTTLYRMNGGDLGLNVRAGSNLYTSAIRTGSSWILGGFEPSGGFAGQFSELVVFDRKLSLAEIKQVEGYLSAKYSFGTIPVSGAALWLDSADQSTLFTDAGVTPVTANGQAIYQWSDKSGNNRHAAQTTIGNRPTWASPANGINGLGVVATNGSSQFFSANNSNTWGLVYSGDFTISIIHKVNSSSGGVLLARDNGSGVVPKWMLGYGSNGVVGAGKFGFHYNGGGFNGMVLVSWTPTVGQTYRFTATRAGNDHYFFINGVQIGTVQTTASRPGNPSVAATIANAESSMWLNGQIGEIIIHESYLNSSQQSQISSYTQAKWGVA